MSVHFPASLGKESQRSPHTSRGGGLNLKLEKKFSGVQTWWIEGKSKWGWHGEEKLNLFN